MALDLNMNVLVVDDYESMLRAIRRLLNIIGFINVDIVNNVEDAMQLLTSGQKTYSLIISDYNMAPADGLDLLRRVRSTAALANLKFVMASADEQPALPARFKEAGADAFLLKPFSTAALESTLTRIFSD